MRVRPEDRFELLNRIHNQFEAEIETLPVELRPAVIRSYSRDDFDSPGLLSLAALPFWVGEVLEQPFNVCMDMAVGNLLLLHCFQSFDFIVDGDRPDTSPRLQVVLGNLCYQAVMRRYGPYFASDSPFWERVQVYWREWGESILWEVEEAGKRRPFSEANLFIAAHKAAALKICPTGLAILAGRDDLIHPFEQAIDWMHAAMQLLDDVKDWREDLEHHRYNNFLGLLVRQGLLPENGAISQATRVSGIIFNTDILDQYANLTAAFARRGKAAIDSLGIEPWSMLMNGLAEQGLWLAQHYKDRLEAILLEQLSPAASV